MESFPTPDQTAETCARIYATEIVTRNGTGSQIITDQCLFFMSSFFQETCKILVKELRAPLVTTLKQMAPLRGGIAHFTRDYLTTFYLMTYRATPNSVTGCSPFCLLYGREMEIPTTIT